MLLMLRYALVMGGLVIVLLFAMHKTMQWAITSEQARELLDTSNSVAESQVYHELHTGTDADEAQLYRSTNDRLFYYVFDDRGRLINFSRASSRIESFVLDIVGTWNPSDREVRVFTKTSDRGVQTKVMMTSQTVSSPPMPIQTVYVGKDVTAMYNGLEKATSALAALGVIAIIFAGYQIAFAHKRISDVAPILIGGVLIGAAGQIAKMLVGNADSCSAATTSAMMQVLQFFA